jgi:hypothetical protein
MVTVPVDSPAIPDVIYYTIAMLSVIPFFELLISTTVTVAFVVVFFGVPAYYLLMDIRQHVADMRIGLFMPRDILIDVVAFLFYASMFMMAMWLLLHGLIVKLF